MKTNHQRSFKETRDPNAVYGDYVVFGESRSLPLSDHSVGAFVSCGDHTNGKRGIAKDRKGAKKFLNSRTRFHENGATKRLAENMRDDDE
jgi:hypothetical protein